ncbi:MAG TPA: hypothetical protein VLG49_07150 [Rhabdochlamydiaceae bacterium]|nr:hypothetical protein [Rhabdochlamydiaceae bacterium]
MRVFGFHIEGQTLKTATISGTKKGIVIENLQTHLLGNAEGENVKQVYIPNSKFATVSGLDSCDVLFREIELSLNKKKKIIEALPFHIESVIPYSPEELILLPFLDGKTGSSIPLLAAKKSSLEEHLEKYRSFVADPDFVSSVPSALVRFATFFASEQSDLFLFHLGQSQSTYSFIFCNELKLSQSYSHGLQDFFNALSTDLPGKSSEEIQELAKKIDLFCIDKQQFPTLSLFVNQFQKDLDRIVSFLKKKNPSDHCPEFLFTGNLSAFLNLIPFLERHLGPSCHLADTYKEYDLSHLQSYAIPIGLCLDAFFQDQQSVQFRRGPFTPIRLRKKRFKQAAAYLMLCCALTALTWISTHVLLDHKEIALREELRTYLEAYGGGIKTELGKEGLEQDIADWEKSLLKQKRPFPYCPSTPQVSDVLAWLSSHPNLNVKGSGPGTEKIEIKQVHYSLVKYPKIGEAIDPYQAKVDLEFSSESPRLAREFHDALMAGDSMVNPQSEITWNVHQNTYRTSFFLKPQKATNIK